MDIMEWLINHTYAWGSDFFYKKFVKDSKKAGKVNRTVLQHILEENKDTIYGQLYHFDQIRNEPDYKQRVPLTYYPDYEKYVEEIAAGQENVLTKDPVRYFGLSSGTTGKQKQIPTTDKSRKIVNLAMMFLQHGALSKSLPEARMGGKGLLLMNMLQSGNTSVGIPTGSGTSGGVQSMKKMLHYFWITPLEVLGIADQETANYLHCLFALQEKELAYIMSPFPSGIVQLFGVMESNWQAIVNDLANGRISPDLAVSSELRTQLERHLKPNPQRAREVSQELELGMNGIAQRLWPRMKYVSCVIGGSFGIYLDRLSYFIGKLPVFSAIYGATEALIGIANKVNDVSYVVTPRSAYFEFIPIEEAEDLNPKTYDLDQLIPGKEYEIAVTNFSGLYRYRLGDVVKVVGYFQQSPVIEFMFRKGQLLNIAGEKTSESAAQEALLSCVKEFGGILEDYSVTLDLEGTAGCYVFYLEMNDADLSSTTKLQFQRTLEEYLGQTNPRYLAGIEAKRIRPLRIYFVRRGTFQVLKQQLLKRGASLNQLKVPRLLRDPHLIEILEQNSLTS